MKQIMIEVPDKIEDEDIVRIKEIIERVMNGMAEDKGDYWSMRTDNCCVALFAQTEKINSPECMMIYVHELEQFMVCGIIDQINR